jgi:GH18 family chitinase
MARERLYT